jgi:hypothetical protein
MSLAIGITLRLTEMRGAPLPARLGPGLEIGLDLFGLQLVEGHTGVFAEEGRAHQVHALPGGPDAGLAGPGAPPDAVGQALGAGLDREVADAARHPRVGLDDGLAGDRGAEELGVAAGQVGVGFALGGDVAEGTRAVQGGLGRAAADAELQAPAGEEVGGASVLGHVERVLIAHVDHAGADLDPSGRGPDRGEQRERRGELALEVVDADEGAVDAERLGGHRQLDRLAQALAGGRGLRSRRVRPMAEAEEADALAMRRVVAHPQIVAGPDRRPAGSHWEAHGRRDRLFDGATAQGTGMCRAVIAGSEGSLD